MASKIRLVKRASAAARFGVTPARINRWVDDGAPVARRGRNGHPALYDVSAIRRWLARRRSGPSPALSLALERARLARSQAEKCELDIATRRRQLVSQEEVLSAQQQIFGAIKTRLLAIPRQIVRAGLVASGREPAVMAFFREALGELAARLESDGTNRRVKHGLGERIQPQPQS